MTLMDFPTDLTGDIARERDLTLDMAGFEQEMEAQRTLPVMPISLIWI